MRGVDTNLLVRYLTQDDPGQLGKANLFFRRVERAAESAYVGIVVLCELAWVLRSLYGFRREEIGRALESLLETALLEIEDRGMVRQALALYREGSGDFADYVIGLRNRREGCRDTVTFDRSLKSSDLFAVL